MKAPLAGTRLERRANSAQETRICRLAWHALADLPQPLTATTQAAVADALAGHSGVLREVQRSPEPDSNTITLTAGARSDATNRATSSTPTCVQSTST